jgi:hypothetical protein
LFKGPPSILIISFGISIVTSFPSLIYEEVIDKTFNPKSSAKGSPSRVILVSK